MGCAGAPETSPAGMGTGALKTLPESAQGSCKEAFLMQTAVKVSGPSSSVKTCNLEAVTRSVMCLRDQQALISQRQTIALLFPGQ